MLSFKAPTAYFPGTVSFTSFTTNNSSVQLKV